MNNQILIPSLEQIIALLPAPVSVKTEAFLIQAHQFAKDIHQERKRLSGELYIEHDQAVSWQLASVGLDPMTMAAGMVHDVLFDEFYDADKNGALLRDALGSDVYNLVHGLNRLVPYTSLLDKKNDPRQLEKLRRAILNSIDNDIRVLVIRMADNLTDLKFANKLEKQQQFYVAREAAEIYAPIANRLGMWSLKWQLEDLSFRYLDGEKYQALAKQIDEKKQERDARIVQRIKDIQVKLEAHHIQGKVIGRSKHIYSIHRKMERKKLPFSEIYDLSALRIVLEDDNMGQCYQTLGLIHGMWSPIPEEFDDYIANPKPNGYRSLHTAIYDSDGQILEVQIRTRAMNDDAERGVAAHWAYKEGGKPSSELIKRVKWLQQLLIDLRDEAPEDTPAENRMINVDDLNRRIYVFTPSDDLIELPEGGTPIDFAYRIHSEVGHRCRGARVNKRMVPLNYTLRPGDRVEIITTKRSGPSRDWMSETAGYAQSGRTRSKVRQWFRDNEREENILRGAELVEEELRRLRHGASVSVPELVEFFEEKTVDDFYARIGFGDISYTQITGTIGLIIDRKKSKVKLEAEPDQEAIELSSDLSQRKAKNPSKGLIIEGLAGLAYHMANCCMPIPPEPIKGYVTRGRGVTVHRVTCSQFQKIGSAEPARVIDVSWGGDQAKSWDVPLQIKSYRRPNLTEDIVKLISGRQIKLTGTKAELIQKTGLSIMNMTVTVQKMHDLEWLTQKLRGMQGVIAVDWKRWS
ncbi:MAG: RelA/SpoT family (p)ppGpp synthetase [Cellvibrionaceae bacterium]|jgi:RelA/SpoT family (p)ppGpp synthetase